MIVLFQTTFKQILLFVDQIVVMQLEYSLEQKKYLWPSNVKPNNVIISR